MTSGDRLGMGMDMYQVPIMTQVREQSLQAALKQGFDGVRLVPDYDKTLAPDEQIFYTALRGLQTLYRATYQLSHERTQTEYEYEVEVNGEKEKRLKIEDSSLYVPIINLNEGLRMLGDMYTLWKSPTQEGVNSLVERIQADIDAANRYGADAYTLREHVHELEKPNDSREPLDKHYLGANYVASFAAFRTTIANTDITNASPDKQQEVHEILMTLQRYVQGAVASRAYAATKFFDANLPLPESGLVLEKIPSPIESGSPDIQRRIADLPLLVHEVRNRITILMTNYQLMDRRRAQGVQVDALADRIKGAWRGLHEIYHELWDSENNPTEKHPNRVLEDLKKGLEGLREQFFLEESQLNVILDPALLPEGVLMEPKIWHDVLKWLSPVLVGNIANILRTKPKDTSADLRIGMRMEKGNVIIFFQDNLGGWPMDILKNGWGFHGYETATDGSLVESHGDGLKQIAQKVSDLGGEMIAKNVSRKNAREEWEFGAGLELSFPLDTFQMFGGIIARERKAAQDAGFTV